MGSQTQRMVKRGSNEKIVVYVEKDMEPDMRLTDFDQYSENWTPSTLAPTGIAGIAGFEIKDSLSGLLPLVGAFLLMGSIFGGSCIGVISNIAPADNLFTM